MLNLTFEYETITPRRLEMSLKKAPKRHVGYHIKQEVSTC